MEHTTGSKVDNMNKVKNAIEKLNASFTIGEVIELTNLNHAQCKKYLQGLCEWGIIKYSETTKIYWRC